MIWVNKEEVDEFNLVSLTPDKNSMTTVAFDDSGKLIGAFETQDASPKALVEIQQLLKEASRENNESQ